MLLLIKLEWIIFYDKLLIDKHISKICYDTATGNDILMYPFIPNDLHFDQHKISLACVVDGVVVQPQTFSIECQNVFSLTSIHDIIKNCKLLFCLNWHEFSSIITNLIYKFPPFIPPGVL